MGTTAQALQVAVTAHSTSPAAAAPATCAAELARYQSEASRLIGTLESMCPGLDACMGGMGHTDRADLMDGAHGLRVELEAHVASACSAASLADELARHQTVMTGHCDHLRERSGEFQGMGGMMGGHGCH